MPRMLFIQRDTAERPRAVAPSKVRERGGAFLEGWKKEEKSADAAPPFCTLKRLPHRTTWAPSEKIRVRLAYGQLVWAAAIFGASFHIWTDRCCSGERFKWQARKKLKKKKTEMPFLLFLSAQSGQAGREVPAGCAGVTRREVTRSHDEREREIEGKYRMMLHDDKKKKSSRLPL